MHKTLSELQSTFTKQTYYRGVRAVKNPMDMWVYSEIIHETKPNVLIEIGVNEGGSTLYFADVIKRETGGGVVALDINKKIVNQQVFKQDNIIFIEAKAQDVVEEVKKLIKPNERVMVIEDSAHTYENTRAVLEAYQDVVTLGNYFIVEDTICSNGLSGFSWAKCYEAAQDFVKSSEKYDIDKSREKYITWSPGGFLKRVK